METLEYVLSQTRKALASLEEAQAHLTKLDDVPIADLRRDVAVSTNASHPASIIVAGKIRHLTDDREEVQRAIGKAMTEAEVLVSIADDLIGQNGRLV